MGPPAAHCVLLVLTSAGVTSQTSVGYKEGWAAGIKLAKERQAAMMAPAPAPVLPAAATSQLQARPPMPMQMAAPRMATNMMMQ
jgi:hypothetical protein